MAYDAGHILGSTSLELTITENGKKYVVVFSGDVGRYDQPILKDPATPPSKCDLLLCESTYGDRDHAPGDPAQELADVINRVAGRGGSVIIPAFAIGRTQTFMYYLREIIAENKIPAIPVYIDSPMALSATDMYVKYREDHDKEYERIEALENGKGDPLSVHEFHLARTADQSKAINRGEDAVHHRVGERHGVGRARVASSGAEAAGCAELRDPGWVSGARDARAGAARRREVDSVLWRGSAGQRGDRDDGAAFGSCGEERAAAMAGRIPGGAEADVSDAWGAGGGAGVASGDSAEVSGGRWRWRGIWKRLRLARRRRPRRFTSFDLR